MESQEYELLRKSIKAQAKTPVGMELIGWLDKDNKLKLNYISDMNSRPVYAWKLEENS